MSGEVEFNGMNSKDDVKINFGQPGSPRKPSEKEVAQYSKLRIGLVVFFGLVIIAMVAAAVVIIIVSPRCAKAKGKLDRSWVKEGVVYQVYPRSFKDSNGDGYGDFKGIIEKLGYLEKLPVKVIRLNSIYDLKNHTQVNSDYGTMKDFEEFLKAAHEKDMKVLLDFIPNHTSDKHPWFVQSKGSTTNAERSWYVWKNGKPGINGTTKPPNNWKSTSGSSAWEKDDTTGQYYLHQFNQDQPDLNLTNSQVKEALKKVLRFWLDKGVDGFVARHVQFMVEDAMFTNELVKTGINASNPYDTLQHTQTFDLSENVAVLEEWKKFMDEEYTEAYRALIVDVKGGPSVTNKYENCSDYQLNRELMAKVDNDADIVQDVNRTIVSYLDTMQEKSVLNWIMGDSETERVAKRLGRNLVDAVNVLVLTLPGVATTYYGEEIGMRGDDSSTSPMQWSDKIYAGFSNKSVWSQLDGDYKTINVESENTKDGASSLKTYKRLLELRSESALKSLELKIVHTDSQVVAYTRGDEQKYLVIINFDSAEWNGDLDELSGRGEVLLDTKDMKNGKTQDVNKIKLQGWQAQILKLTVEY